MHVHLCVDLEQNEYFTVHIFLCYHIRQKIILRPTTDGKIQLQRARTERYCCTVECIRQSDIKTFIFVIESAVTSNILLK